MVNEKTDEGLKPAVGVPGLALAVLLVFYRGSHFMESIKSKPVENATLKNRKKLWIKKQKNNLNFMDLTI